MESKAKNSNGTKNIREQNLFQIEQKLLLKAQKMLVNKNRVQSENINDLYFSCRFLRLLCLSFCELAWSFMAFLWSCLAFHGFFMLLNGRSMAFYGKLSF